MSVFLDFFLKGKRRDKKLIFFQTSIFENKKMQHEILFFCKRREKNNIINETSSCRRNKKEIKERKPEENLEWRMKAGVVEMSLGAVGPGL